jgi:hypothetical protein
MLELLRVLHPTLTALKQPKHHADYLRQWLDLGPLLLG